MKTDSNVTHNFTQEEIAEAAKFVIENTKSKILLFYGEMGTGKTTIIKAILQELGGADLGNSPSFGIVNEYHYPNGNLLGYHFDFYRIEDEMEALDFGLEDYFSQDVWLFFEWPERINTLLPQEAQKIILEWIGENKRKLIL